MHGSGLTLGFGFGHLAMLPWLAAAAVPLLIHLWNRRRRREVPWAAMEWLLAALRKNARRLRLEQWLLLAVRTLIIVCVVLAVAEPYFEPLGLSPANEQHSHKLIVMDGSFSMGAKSGEKSAFDRAKEFASRIVEVSTQGDAFTLLVAASPPRPIISSPAFQPRDVLRELEGLKLTHGPMDLLATLAKAEEILHRARDNPARAWRQEVLLLTDLQRASWFAEPGSPRAVAVRQIVERLARLARIHVVDLGEQPSENAAISDLRVVEAAPTADRDITIEAHARHFGRHGPQRKRIELFVDGRKVGENEVQLEAAETASASFHYRFDTPGEHKIEARLQADALELDNRRWLALPVKDAVRVLCVDGKPASGEFGASTDYLTVALAPQEGNSLGLVQPTVIRDSQLVETSLVDYDCIFFCNVGQFTAAEARLVRDYLQGGGGVVFFLGDQVKPDSYNRFLGGGESGIPRLLPAIIGPQAPEADYRIDPLGYRHPLLTVFRDQEQAGLITAPIQRYFRLTPQSGSQANVALALSSGDPIVIEEPRERGRVILAATSADTSWSMMPVLPSYVPLIHELLNLAMREHSGQRNVEVGQPLSDDLRGTGPATIETPSGERHATRLPPDARAWSYDETAESGIYRVDFEGALGAKLFAVNVNTIESDLERLSADQLRNEVWPKIDFQVHTTWQETLHAAMATAARPATLNLVLLYLALGLVLLEPVLAWRQGRHPS